MKLLFLAPQPFFQERGTPIAVRLALQTLGNRLSEVTGEGTAIDLLVYNEGEDVSIPGVTIHRVSGPQWMVEKWLRGIKPGISCKKLFIDVLFFIQMLRLLWRARRDQYRVVHAVEESVFMAWFAKYFFKTPYVYDMDSSLAQQLTEKWWWFAPFSNIFELLERMVVRGAAAVAPVCDALESLANKHGALHTVMLRDVSLLPSTSSETNEEALSLRQEVGLVEQQPLILYVGNLESYQGIDLLVEAFQLACSHPANPHLVVVGGDAASVRFYQQRCQQLGCALQVSFLGPRPVAHLKSMLTEADIVVSPRIKGNNTPMKVYSYLHCGRALLATNLPTHTQVLDQSVCILADPTAKAFADGMILLLSDPGLRREIGDRAKARAEKLYTLEAFEVQMLTLYRALGLSQKGSISPHQLAVSENA